MFPNEIYDRIFCALSHSKDRFVFGLTCKRLYKLYQCYSERYISEILDNKNVLLDAIRNNDPIIIRCLTFFPSEFVAISELTVTSEILIEILKNDGSGETEHQNVLWDEQVYNIAIEHAEYLEFSKKFLASLLRNDICKDLVDHMCSCIYNSTISPRERDELILETAGIIYVNDETSVMRKRLDCLFESYPDDNYERDMMRYKISAEYFYMGNYRKGEEWYKKIEPSNIGALVDCAIGCLSDDEKVYDENFCIVRNLVENYVRENSSAHFPKKHAEYFLLNSILRGEHSLKLVNEWISTSDAFKKSRPYIDYCNVWLKSGCKDKFPLEILKLDMKECMMILLNNAKLVFPMGGKTLHWCFDNMIKHDPHLIKTLDTHYIRTLAEFGMVCPKCKSHSYIKNITEDDDNNKLRYRCTYCINEWDSTTKKLKIFIDGSYTILNDSQENTPL